MRYLGRQTPHPKGKQHACAETIRILILAKANATPSSSLDSPAHRILHFLPRLQRPEGYQGQISFTSWTVLESHCRTASTNCFGSRILSASATAGATAAEPEGSDALEAAAAMNGNPSHGKAQWPRPQWAVNLKPKRSSGMTFCEAHDKLYQPGPELMGKTKPRSANMYKQHVRHWPKECRGNLQFNY